MGSAREAARPGRRAFVAVARALVCALVVALPLAPPAAAANLKVEVAARAEQGYGRLVLLFRDRRTLPVYSAKLLSGVFVIEFGEPVDVEVATIAATLKNYVSVARRDPEGGAIRFALAQGVRVNTIEAGERLFIDFLPATWTALPPQLPPEVLAELGKRTEEAMRAARRAEADRAAAARRAKLDVRIADAPTFSRIVFNWNVSYDANVARRDDGALEILFSRTAPVDLGQIRSRLPPGVIDIEMTEEDARLKTVIKLERDVQIRTFREELAYVVDVTKPIPRVAMPSMPSPIAPLMPPPMPGPSIAEMAPPAAGEASPGPAEAPHPSPLADMPTPAPSPPPPSMTPSPPPRPPTPAAVAPTIEAPDGPHMFHDEGPVRAEAKTIGSMARIVFPFAAPVASAVFQRDRTIWAVFETTKPVDVSALAAGLGSRAEKIEVEHTGTAEIVRIELAEPLLASVVEEGASWTIAIGDTVVAPPGILSAERTSVGGDRLALRIALPGASAAHVLTDPRIGDRIVAVTSRGPPRGLLKPQSFVELSLLPSAHGVAAVMVSDDVRAEINGGAVVFGGARGLSLSAVPPQRRADLTPRDTRRRDTTEPPDLADLAARDIPELRHQRRRLEQAAADAEEMDRKARRMDLARFLVSNRLGAEAMGVLDLLARTSNAADRDPRFQVLRAAAAFLVGRPAEAAAVLRRPDLAQDDEAAFWRTLAAGELNQWAEANEAAERGAIAAATFPRDLRLRFDLTVAEADLELGKPTLAADRLSSIDRSELEPALAGRHDILQAQLVDGNGRVDDALFLLDRAAKSGDRRVEAQAEFHRIRILSREGKLASDEAIRRLQALSLAWRGDEQAIATLASLADRLAEAGRYREAFTTMREAMRSQPESTIARRLQDDMQRVFVGLFHDGKADALKPIEALALFYDFRELTPPGRQGDEIVRRLADRLVAADLIDQAAELLTYQVDNRLKGAARSQVAADLAVVHLIDHHPERALAVLAKSRQAELPQAIERQRRIVEAKALAESGKIDLALELLGPLRGADAEHVAADTLWKAERYQAAAERYEAMVSGRWSDATPLDADERLNVLKAAIGYGLAKDVLGLERLRSKFTAKMASGPESRAFEVLSAPIESRGVEARTIAHDIAAVDTMRGFLAEYRKRYLGGGPAEPMPADAPPQPAAEAPAPPRVASR